MAVDIDIIFRLGSLAIVVSVLYTVLKQAGRDEYAYMTVLAGVAIAFMWVIPAIAELFRQVEGVFRLY